MPLLTSRVAVAWRIRCEPKQRRLRQCVEPIHILDAFALRDIELHRKAVHQLPAEVGEHREGNGATGCVGSSHSYDLTVSLRQNITLIGDLVEDGDLASGQPVWAGATINHPFGDLPLPLCHHPMMVPPRQESSGWIPSATVVGLKLGDGQFDDRAMTPSIAMLDRLRRCVWPQGVGESDSAGREHGREYPSARASLSAPIPS